MVLQDQAITLEVLLESIKMYEDECNQWGSAIPLISASIVSWRYERLQGDVDRFGSIAV